ncbi:MAG TPA: hypothetical protein VK843_01050 [Planctomycetota bacterium]|nr:hypothetical protein [Planctomycetota bacterium]
MVITMANDNNDDAKRGNEIQKAQRSGGGPASPSRDLGSPARSGTPSSDKSSSKTPDKSGAKKDNPSQAGEEDAE